MNENLFFFTKTEIRVLQLTRLVRVVISKEKKLKNIFIVLFHHTGYSIEHHQ